ncbi:hypothetical protein B0T17DRAFT_283957 [Bombardia bombarda]|uniref:Uncharacterized protein n=1 Tax=Bombardia bombarda TaxID=252184 RepID=A0AA39WTJ7_9PEZI|nr:hypothetical protein B0T17DRAFT_283957 [Bombardia bombarda]
MCYGATCPTCSKQAWKGCGSHLSTVFSGVPEDKWCVCEPKVDVNGTSYPPQAASGGVSMPSWMKSWTGTGSAAQKE